MSTTQSPQPSHEDVLPTLAENVFFNKLASLGFSPESEEEAVCLLDIAQRLRNVPLEQLYPEGYKQAKQQQTKNRFAKAAGFLQGVSEQAERFQAFGPTPQAQLATDVARMLQDNPLIKQAALLQLKAQA